MRRAVVVCAVLLWASGVMAECGPEGRATFAAGLQALNRGDLTAASNYFTELVKAQPDCAEARNNLAAVLVEQGHLDAAAEHLRRALQLKPDYERARLNLQRVEGMLATRAQPAPPEKPKIEVSAEPAAAPLAAAQPPVAAVTPPGTLTTAAQQAAGSVPLGAAVLEPVGATACVLDANQNRICVYRRTQDAIVSDACYPIAAAHVRAWPQWVTASDLNARRIRLVDETGVKRLKIVPANRAGGSDEVRLAPADFEALSAKVTAWRTGWLVRQGEASFKTPDSGVARAVTAGIELWRQAWERKHLDDYASLYSRSFQPQSDSNLERWRERKRRLFEQSGSIAVQVNSPSIFVLEQGTAAIATFDQSYRSDATAAHDFKALRWERDGDSWKISGETVLQEQ